MFKAMRRNYSAMELRDVMRKNFAAQFPTLLSVPLPCLNIPVKPMRM
jgi:hypothetical protein